MNISPQKRFFFFIEVRLPGTVGGDPRQHREGQKGQEVQEGKKGEEKEGNVFLQKTQFVVDFCLKSAFGM